MKVALKIGLCSLLALIKVQGWAQSFECGTDASHAELMQQESTYQQSYLANEAQIQSILQQQLFSKPHDSVYTIPVVVHVIHEGESVGTGTNISDFQIQGAITGLNERFGAVIGAGVDVEIEFCLAVRDPNDNVTSGINRVSGVSIANYVTNGIYHGSGNPTGADGSDVKDLSKWPVCDYYNIWVVNYIGSLGGYAYYPTNCSFSIDGTVIRYDQMSSSLSPLTHELGHAFSTYHTFYGDGNNTMCPVDTNCLVNGDKICDTQPHKKGDCGTTNPCSGSGLWDNSRFNYMSYCNITTVDELFTQGQKDRMRASMLVSPRLDLLSSLGCVPLTPNDAGITQIIAPVNTTYTSYCITPDTINPVVEMRNFGTDTLTSATINYALDNGPTSSISWNGSVPPGAYYNVSLPAIPVVVGSHFLSVYTESPNGSADGFIANDSNHVFFYIDIIRPIIWINNVIHASCSGSSDGSAIATVTGGIFPYTYIWNDSAAQSSALATGLAAGTYNVTVTDSIGCVAVDTVVIQYSALSATIYECAGVAWIQKADFAGTDRRKSVSFSIGTKGYVGTGFVSGILTYYKDFWEYDPATDVWTQLADFAGTARQRAVGFSIGNRGYLGTGEDGVCCSSYLKDFWEYDPDLNVWSIRDSFPGARRSSAAAFSIADKGYVGTGVGQAIFDDFWEYDPTLDQWTQKANYGGGPVSGAAAFNIGGKGYIGTGGGGKMFWEYDPITDNWTQKADYGGLGKSYAAAFAIGTKGYIGTGSDANPGTGSTEFWEWQQATDVWTQKTDYSGNPTYGTASFSIGSKGYVGLSYSYFWEYNPCSVMISSQSDVSCLGDTNGTVTVFANDGTPPYTYAWDDPNLQTNAFATGLAPGTYNVTITDSCSSTATTSVTINEPSLLSVSTSQFNVPCLGGSNGKLTAVVSGGTMPYSYVWDDPDTQVTATATGLAAGMYHVTVTDTNGCSVSDTVALTEGTSAIVLTMTQTDVSCNNFSDGSAAAYASGGVLPYFYSWDDTASQTTDTASGLIAGSYTVGVSDTTGCTVWDSVTLTQPERLMLSYSQTNVTCGGINDGSATIYTYREIIEDFEDSTDWITVNGTEVNQWVLGTATSNGGGSSMYVSDGGFDNTYTTTIPARAHVYKDFNFPSGATNITITFDWKGYGANSFDNMRVFLLPTSIMPVAGSGLSGSYTIGSLYNQQATFITETITGLDSVANSTRRLAFSWWNAGLTGTQPPAAIDNIIVSYNDTTLGNFTYNWSNGQTTPTSTGLTAGTYLVTVSDSVGCSEDTVTITEPSSIIDSITQTSITCNGDSNGTATVVAPDTVQVVEDWETSHTWTLVNGTQANQWMVGSSTSSGGFQSMYISNNGSTNGYTTSSTSKVFFYKDFTFPSWASDITVQFDWKAKGESGWFDYLKVFLAPTSLTPVAGSNNIPAQYGIGASKYQLNSSFTTETITGLDAIAVDSTKRLIFNWVNDGSAGSQPPAALDNIIVSFVSTAGVLCTWNSTPVQNTPTATNLSPGIYTVTVTDQKGCTNMDSVNITDPPIISYSLSSVDATCLGGADGQASITVGGGVPPYTYAWDDPATQTTETATGLMTGTYEVVFSDSTGCIKSDTVNVGEPGSTISLTFSQGNVSCNGDSSGSATVTPSGGVAPYTYLWDDPTAQTNATATGLAQGTYSVTVTDNLQCPDTAVFTILEPDALTLTNLQLNVSCYGGADGSSTVSANGGTSPFTYLWNDPTAQTNAVATGLATGIFMVSVTDSCLVSETVDATILEPSAILLSTSQIQQDSAGTAIGQASVLASGGTPPYTYLWNDSGSQTTIVATGLLAGSYSVTVTDSGSCTAIETVSISNYVGIQDYLSLGVISIYPNPTDGKLTFDIQLAQTSTIEVHLFNLLGEELYSKSMENITSIKHEIDLTGFVPGLYFFQVSNKSIICKVSKIMLE